MNNPPLGFNSSESSDSTLLSMLVKSLSVLTFCSCSAISEDMVSLYKSFLPSSLVKDSELNNMLSSKLTVKAQIHPDLIYYQIELARNLFDESQRRNQATLRDFVFQKEKDYLCKRSDWASKQKAKLIDCVSSGRAKTASISYFDALILDTAQVSYNTGNPFPIDSNLIDFFDIVYEKQNSSLSYDSSINYHEIRTAQEKLVLARDEAFYCSIDSTSSAISESDIENIAQHWYIYSGSGHDSTDPLKFHDAYRIIERATEHNFSTNSRGRFSLNVGYCPYNSTFIISQSLPVSYVQYPSYSHQPTDFDNPAVHLQFAVQQLITSLGYRAFLSQEIGSFSYINFQVMLSFNTAKAEINDLHQQTSNFSGPQFDILMHETMIRQSVLHTMNCYTAKVSSPFIVIGRSIFLEVAATAGVLHVSSSTSYEYHMNETEGYMAGSISAPYYYSHSIAAGIGKGQIELVHNYFKINPTFDCTYETDSAIRFNLSLSPNYAALICGYSL